jgi:DNA-binding transcriptional MerR regulator
MFYPEHMEKTYTISGVAECTGVSIDTLRYYERIGLIHEVDRLSNTHRRYTESDIQWIQFLLRLRATGMSIQQMLRYARLQRLGESTLRERVAMLKAHHEQVEVHIQQMQEYLVVLDQKITMYESTLLAREAEKVEETAP